jgi:hypothetical protein
MWMVGIVVEVSIRVCCFPLDSNVEFSIFPCNYRDKEVSVVFMFEGELYSRVHWIQSIVECRYSVLLNDGQTIINKAFPGLGMA